MLVLERFAISKSLELSAAGEQRPLEIESKSQWAKVFACPVLLKVRLFHANITSIRLVSRDCFLFSGFQINVLSAFSRAADPLHRSADGLRLMGVRHNNVV